MTKTNLIPFGEMRRLLTGLGYAEKCTDKGRIFHRSKKDLIVFPLYADGDPMRSGEMASTRRFLDMRGILDQAEFDSFFEGVNKSA